MDCKTARKWISPYLDSELDTATTFEISEHVRACEMCRRRFESERSVDVMMRGKLSESGMPPTVWAGLRREVNRSQWSGHLRFAGVVMAAAACVALAVTWFGWRDGSTGSGDAFPGAWSTYVNQTIAADDMIADTQIDDVLRERYGLSLARAREMTGGHPVEYLGAREVMFGNRPAMEIRLKCCGRNAVMTVLRTADATLLPADLRSLMVDAAGRDLPRDGVNVRVERIGDVEAFIAAKHHLEGLATALRPDNV